MVNRRARYGWMALGGLLCLLGLVAVCRFRDGNRAHAQQPDPAPAADKCEKKTAEPPLAEPRTLPPVGVGVLQALNPPAPPKAKTPSGSVVPAAAELPAIGSSKDAPAPLGSEPRPILIPAGGTTAAVAPPAPPPPPGKPPCPPPTTPTAAPPDAFAPPPPAPPAPPAAAPAGPPRPPEVKVDTPPPPPGSDVPPPSGLVPHGPPPSPPASPAPTVRPCPADDAVRPLPLLRSRPGPRPKAVLPLTGTYPVKLQGKDLTLPKAILAQLGGCGTVLLSPGSDKCLWLTNQAHLDRLAAKLDRSPAREADVRGFRRLYYAQTVKAPLKDGKVVIADKLAQFAGLGQDVVLVGIDDHFEVWDAARWKRYTQAKKAAPVED